MKRRAVYAGTYDILTKGHWWVIEQGLMLFDHLDIAIGVNASKKDHYFTIDERRSMIQLCLDAFLVPGNRAKVSVFEGEYLVNYARRTEAQYLIRGVRNQTDYNYELVLRNINADIDGGITTVFLMPPKEIADVSSSMVKGLIGPEGWENVIRQYLPVPVYSKVVEKESARTKS